MCSQYKINSQIRRVQSCMSKISIDVDRFLSIFGQPLSLIGTRKLRIGFVKKGLVVKEVRTLLQPVE